MTILSSSSIIFFFLLLLLIPIKPSSSVNLPIAIFDWLSDIEDGVRVFSEFQLYSTFYVSMTLAVKHFNERRSEFNSALAGLTTCDKNLTMLRYCDDMGLHQLAVKDAYELVVNDNLKAIVGTVQAQESTYTTSLLNTIANGAPVVSYWMSSPITSDKSQFPNFVRTGPSDADFGVIVAVACAQWGFKSVAGLIIRGDSGQQYNDALFSELLSRGISFQSLSFTAYDPVSIDKAVAGLSVLGLNVVIIASYSYDLASISDSMSQYGMLNDDTFFILTYLDVWPTVNDTQADANLTTFLHGSVRIDRALVNGTNPQWEAFRREWASPNGFTMERDFVNAHVPPNGLGNDGSTCVNDNANLRISETYFMDTFNQLEVLPEVLASAYDAIMAVGIGECHSPSPGVLVEGAELTKNIISSSFNGLSGFVQFKDSGDRDVVNFRMFNFFALPDGNIGYNSTGQWNNGTWYVGPQIYKKGIPPVDITIPVPNYNYISTGLRDLGYAETALLWFCNLFLHVWLIIYRRDPVVVNSQGELLHVIIVGLWISSCAILCLTADDSPQDLLNEQIACMAAPVLYVLGFQVITVALLGKMQRILTLFHNPTMRRRVVRTRTVLMVIFLVVLAEMLVVIAWIFVGPLTWVRQTTLKDQHGNTLESHGYCTAQSNSSLGFLITVIFLQLAALALLGWYTNKVKDLPSKFHEARFLALAVVSLGQMYLICVPVTYAVLTSENGRFVVTTSLVFFSNLSIVLFLFVPKIIMIHFHWDLFGTTASSGADTGPHGYQQPPDGGRYVPQGGGVVVGASAPVPPATDKEKTDSKVHVMTQDGTPQVVQGS